MTFAALDADAPATAHGHMLADRDTAVRFMEAGNATFTIVSKKTGARYTYRIRKPKDAAGEIAFVSLLVGPSNESDFQYIGFIRDRKFQHGGKKARAGLDAPSVVAFGWTWLSLIRDSHMPTTAEIWHEGRCGRCHRKLTVPSSIASGLGPECASREA